LADCAFEDIDRGGVGTDCIGGRRIGCEGGDREDWWLKLWDLAVDRSRDRNFDHYGARGGWRDWGACAEGEREGKEEEKSRMRNPPWVSRFPGVYTKKDAALRAC